MSLRKLFYLLSLLAERPFSFFFQTSQPSPHCFGFPSLLVELVTELAAKCVPLVSNNPQSFDVISDPGELSLPLLLSDYQLIRIVGVGIHKVD